MSAPIEFADEATMDSSELVVGDFIVRTCALRYRGPRGGSYLVRPVRVERIVESLSYDGNGNQLVRLSAIRDARMILYPGQQVVARRRLDAASVTA